MVECLNNTTNQRDSTVDIMKGIAILAMIIGHCPIPMPLELFIFVWHMPLFFLVSGYFYKPKPIYDYFSKNARQLLIPYYVTSFALILIVIAKKLILGKGDVLSFIIAALLGSGSTNNPTFSEYSIGAIWFLMAMFWCRSLYNVFHYKIQSPIKLGVVIICISVIATYVGSYIYLPLNILEGFEAMLFFYIGSQARKYNLITIKIEWFVYLLIGLLVLLSIHSGAMSMVRCFYGYWPVNFIAAIGVALLLYHISRNLINIKFLAWCGRVSLVILCVHIVCLEHLPISFFHNYLMMHEYCDFIIHILLTLGIVSVLLRFVIVRKLFSIS